MNDPRALKPLTPVCAPRVLHPCGIPPRVLVRAETHLLSQHFGVGSLDDTHSTAAYVQRHSVLLAALRSCLRAYRDPRGADPHLGARELLALLPDARWRAGVGTPRARRFERAVLLQVIERAGDDVMLGMRADVTAIQREGIEAVTRRTQAYTRQADAYVQQSAELQAALERAQQALAELQASTQQLRAMRGAA